REKIAALVTLVVADDEADVGSARARKLLELVAKDDVVVVQDAIEHDDVAAHLLEQRADRRDADAAGDEHDLFATANRLGERAEWAFGDDQSARPHAADLAGEIAECLHGDAQRTIVRGGRERKRMR